MCVLIVVHAHIDDIFGDIRKLHEPSVQMLGMLDECIEMAGEMKQDVHWLAFNRSEGHGLGNRRCQINWLDIDLSLWHHVVSCKDIWHESINLVDFYEFCLPYTWPSD